MKKEIIDYIASQKVGVLAVEMLDGSPHGAAVHFAFAIDPASFYIFTDTDTKKYEALADKGSTRATIVIGANPEDMRTLQMSGILAIPEGEALARAQGIYFEKFPKKKEWMNDLECALLAFTPTWWRYTDWTTPSGKEITLSTD